METQILYCPRLIEHTDGAPIPPFENLIGREKEELAEINSEIKNVMKNTKDKKQAKEICAQLITKQIECKKEIWKYEDAYSKVRRANADFAKYT